MDEDLPIEELERLARKHQALRRKLPNAWNGFFARFGTLRDVQLAAIPPIIAGKDVLVTAPTAGGKTEAVLAPICERVAQERWDGLSVLLITPTRALVNDLYARLEKPCDYLGLRIGRKTADHGLDESPDEQLLITTPESTESLLTFRRELLAGVRVVVIDEIHLLDGSPRGDQLRMILGRLAAYLRHVRGELDAGIQRIAMSATVPSPERLAAVYLGPDAAIVQVPGQRRIDARVIVASGDDEARAQKAIDTAAEWEDVHKILVFVNSRKQVDTAAGFFRHGSFAEAPVFGHHGVLSKEMREEVESRFSMERRAVCVATTTLEVGIDIGDIDLVICMDPPFSLASFLQRIGRGCRRLHGATRVLCVARDGVGRIMFDALIRQARIGLPPAPVPPMRRSVLVQQSIAYLRQVQKNRRLPQQFVNVFASSATPIVREECVREVLKDLSDSGVLDQQNDWLQLASAGWDFVESRKIYGNIQPPPTKVALVDVDTGNVVATVAGVGDFSSGVRVAGKSYTILPGSSDSHVNVREGGRHSGSPIYHATRLPYAFDVGAAIRGSLGIAETEIVAIRLPSELLVLTWLGRLLNAALAKALQSCGYDASAGSFGLSLSRRDEPQLLTLIRRAVDRVLEANPLGELRVERFADLGPYFEMLTPALQREAREDWLDRDFLGQWAVSISTCRVMDASSPDATDLLPLGRV